MKEITVTEPHFVTTFSCSGSSCREHCCKGWKITLDKATVKKYLSSNNETIRKIAKENIILLKKGIDHWGEIKLPTASDNCPYLDEERLCNVHKMLGPKALSRTCSTFPRIQHIYKHEVRRSLSLACPEAAERLLNDPGAMTMADKTVIKPQLNTAPVFQPEQKLLNLFCLSIINHAEARPEAALYALIKFMLVVQKFTRLDTHALAELEQVYMTLIAQLRSGELAEELNGIHTDGKVKISLILQMQNYFCSLPTGRGSIVLDQYIQCLLRVLTAEENIDMAQRVGEMEALLDKWLLKDQPHGAYALRNFILYKIWENNFPNQPDVEPLRALYMIVAEYAFIKLHIAASVSERGRLEWEDVTNIIYSFHSRSQHNRDVANHFYQHIETIRTGDDLSMIHLLT